MRTDLRVKHDAETRRRASELFERGYGRISTAKALRVPRQTVEKWQQIYRAIGREALLSMGGKQASYTYEQQADLLDRLLERMPEGARPVVHSDMGWQYQHAGWCGRLKAAGIVQSMSRKGNCIDNGATEQVFGHIKDEFFRGRTWPDFESFKADLDDYVVRWNTRRRQVKLKGLTPEEFRSQSLVA